jgi:hypothetical protein
LAANGESQDPEDEPPDDKSDITALQIFALSYLYSEESAQRQRQKEQYLDSQRLVTHYSHSSVLSKPIHITVRELITILPFSIVSETPTAQEVCDQLNILAERGLLEGKGSYISEEYASYYITGTGMLFIKRYYAGLSKAIKDKRVYEECIESIEGNSKIKEFLKGIGSKLKERSQEDIADEVLSGVKTYGPLLITSLINIVTKSPS